MNILLKDIKAAEYASDALIVPLCWGERRTPYRDLDSALAGLIGRIISSGEFSGKHAQTVLFHTAGRIRPDRVLLVGLGRKNEITSEKMRQAGGKAASYLAEMGFRKISLAGEYFLPLKQSPVSFIEGALLALYRFRKYKKEGNGKAPESLTLLARPVKALQESLRWAETTSSAVHFAKDLINAPANDMTPSALAKIARGLARGKVSVTVLEKEDAAREGMGAYLSVAKGSAEPSKFIILRYRGGRRGAGAPVVIIGKAITFDSGGLSLKPSEGMEKMKYDMAGGAVVLGVVRVAAECNLPVNLVGIVPASENLPGGSASRPGDIVKTITGKTVEIISTDAEGRMVLADAIGYARRMKPKAIIDIATLTGACSIALGNEAIAMMGNDEGIMKRLKEIGDETYERVWQMPLFEEYLEYLKSDFADIKNTGGRTGALVAAGCFLKEFAGDAPWVHLDIAGTAWAEKERNYISKGATGIGVRLLSQFLKETK